MRLHQHGAQPLTSTSTCLQLMPAGEAPVLCSRSRDACRLALVVLPPAVPPLGPPSGAFGPPAADANGLAPGSGGPTSPGAAKQLPPLAAHAVGGSSADAAVAGHTAQPAPQAQHPISEIVSLETADALGAGAGAVIFVHRELAELEALAQRLEKDEAAALHGEVSQGAWSPCIDRHPAPLAPVRWLV